MDFKFYMATIGVENGVDMCLSQSLSNEMEIECFQFLMLFVLVDLYFFRGTAVVLWLVRTHLDGN